MSLHQALLVIDLEARFDVTRLSCRDEEKLRHVYVCRPARCGAERLKEVVSKAQEWMLFGRHESSGRELWGTVVIGGAEGDVSCGFRGWLRVDRREEEEGALGAAAIPGGLSADTALELRSSRSDTATPRWDWVATCEWGEFHFAEGCFEVRSKADKD